MAEVGNPSLLHRADIGHGVRESSVTAVTRAFEIAQQLVRNREREAREVSPSNTEPSQRQPMRER
jgi:hypothetical protein